jgi:ABC-2 type transport system permease protein
MFTKYLALIKRSFILSITFRAEVILWLMLDSFPIIILLLVWASAYTNTQNSINGYSLEKIIGYYFLASLIDGITSTHFESWRVTEIREGKIDFYLTRPLSYLKELFFRDVGGKSYYLTIALPFFILFFYGLSKLVNINLPSAGILQLINFAFFLLLGYITQFLFGAIIVTLGFYFEHAEGLEHFKWLSTALFTGWMIPIPLMPSWLSKIVLALPLKYLFAMPIGIIQQTMSPHLGDYIYFISFISLLYIILLLLWRRAKYQYASAGG